MLRYKLTEMISELEEDDEYYNRIIDEEIERLNNKKR